MIGRAVCDVSRRASKHRRAPAEPPTACPPSRRTRMQIRGGGVNRIGMVQLFKWIKQHLRIKAFFGTSENAVKTQIWIAISVYVLVAIIKKQLNLDLSLYTILQIL
jgi:hypothetical protein